MNWKRVGKEITKEGTTITYSLEGTDLKVESRKRHIEHSGGDGTWDHTTYFAMKDGKDIKELWTLKEAKKYVEKLAMQMEEQS